MKKVILSADGDSIIYLVPDIVADNLEKYCIEFCDDWLWHSPQAAKYRMGAGVCYSEADFIDYLNKYKFPNEKSETVKNLGWTGLGEELLKTSDYRLCDRNCHSCSAGAAGLHHR